MPRRVQQGDGLFRQGQNGLLGKDGNPSLPFQWVGIKKGIFMVDSALFADDTCLKQQCLRKRCFSGIYMGENANDGILIHIDSNPICFVVSFILCVKKGWFYYSIFYALRQCCAVYFVGTAHWNDYKIFVYCFDFRRCIA